MAKIALLGGAYQARSVVAAAQRQLNLYTEPLPQQQGEPSPMAHYPTPGTTLLITMPPGPIRGIHQASNGITYIVSGQNVYSVDLSSPAGWATAVVIGTLVSVRTTPVSMADNGLDMLIVDGSTIGYDVTLATGTFTQIPTTNTVTPATAAAVVFIASDWGYYSPFTAPISGAIGTATISLATGYTGNMTFSLFDATGPGGGPGATLGFAVTIANPVAGDNVITFETPVAVTAATAYWLGFDSDTTAGSMNVASGTTGFGGSTAYTDFPAASPNVFPTPAFVFSLTVSNDAAGFFSEQGADKVDYLDGYFLLNKPGTPQFFISGFLAVSFDPLDFANKETASDLLKTLIVNNRYVMLLGDRTTEVWFDQGPVQIGTEIATFPFDEAQGTFIDHGVVAKYSPAIYDNAMFWLSRDRQGQGLVLMWQGNFTRRISTFAIEHAINGYARIDDAIGFTYQLSGHTFYVLTFPTGDQTWVCDISSITMTSPLIAPQPPFWHEWSTRDSNGIDHRHRANCFALCNGTPVVGDWENGNLYRLSNDVYTDNGQTIKRVRSFPHIVADGKRVFFREVIFDIETGTGPDTTDANTISLEISYDRGHSYGSPVMQTMGGIGNYKTSVQYQRCGMGRDAIFRISWSNAAPTVLQGAWVRVEPADSTEAVAAPAQQDAS